MREKTKKLKNCSLILFFLLLFLSISIFCILLNKSSGFVADKDKITINQNTVMNSSFSGGDGATIDSAYELSTPQDLIKLAEGTNDGQNVQYLNKFFIQTNDIDISDVCLNLTEGKGWKPIGQDSLYPFSGNYDGRGYRISGLSIIRADEDNIGLFGELSPTATIANLKVEGNIIGRTNVGAIAGVNNGKIINCYNFSTISTNNALSMNIGGIAGTNNNLISKSYNFGNISIVSGYYIGGIVGKNEKNLEHSFNNGNIATNATIVGGVTGQNNNGSTISSCFNSASVSADSTVGGITGYNLANITNTYNKGLVTAASASNGMVGGIAGANSGGNISNSYNNAAVTGLGFKGAISGNNTGTINRCFHNSDILGSLVLSPDGGVILNSHIVDPYSFIKSNTLDVGGDLEKIASGAGSGAWSKKIFDNDNCFFPNLSAFNNETNELVVSTIYSSLSMQRNEIKESDICVEKDNFIYNGLEQTLIIFIGSDAHKVELIKDIDFTVIYTNNINAASADEIKSPTAVFTFINYYFGEISKTFSINKKELIIEWTCEAGEAIKSLEKFVYNGKVQYPTAFKIHGKILGESVSLKYILSTVTNNLSAGTHTIETLLETDGSNAYNANYYLSNYICEYQIDKSSLTFVWSEELLTYNGAVQIPSASVTSGKIDSENLSFIYNYMTDCKSAGSNAVKVELEDSNPINYNYIILLEEISQEKSYIIEQKKISIVWNSTNLVYNGEVQYHKVLDFNGVVDGENVTFSYSGYENNINANINNVYFVNCALESSLINFVNANYSLVSNAHYYNIEKKTISIDYDISKIIYNGRPQAPKILISNGNIANDEIVFNYSNYNENVNSSQNNKYSVIVSLAVNEVNKNYNMLSQTIYYDILKAPVKIIWQSDELSYNGKAQVPTYSLEGVIKGENITMQLSDYSLNIYPNNQYSITAALEQLNLENENYYLYEGALNEYSISKKFITIVDLIPEDRVYNGEKDITLTGGKLEGLIDSDSLSFKIISSVVEDAQAGKNKNVILEIKLEGKNLDYYDLKTPVVISVEIFKAQVDISHLVFEDKTFTHTGSAQSIFVIGELPQGATIQYENNGKINVGEYEVKAIFKLDDELNYEIPQSLIAEMKISNKQLLSDNNDVEINVEDGYIPYGAVIKTNKLDGMTNIDMTLAENKNILNSKKLLLNLDISLEAEGIQVQPNGTVKVKIKLDSKYLNAKNIAFAYLDNQGKIILLDFVFDNGELVFYVTHFTQFIIYADEEVGVDLSILWLILAVIIILLILAMTFFIIKKQKKLKVNFEIANTSSKDNQTLTDNSNPLYSMKTVSNECNKEDPFELDVSFSIDGIFCKSFTCFTKGLDFKDKEKQNKVCGGDEAQALLYESKPLNSVFWQGKRIRVQSKDYIELIEKVKALIIDKKGENYENQE